MQTPDDPADARTSRSFEARAGASAEIEYVFGDERPFSQCHAATIVALPGDRVLAAWFAGTHEGHRDVAIWAAARRNGVDEPGDDDRRTLWSEPRVIAKMDDAPHWNPVLFALDEVGDEVVLHFKVGRRIRQWVTWSQHSRDGGDTWSDSAPLVPGDRGGRGAVRTKPVRLASGDWLAGASLERWLRWDAFFDRSPDGRSDWVRTPLVPIDRNHFEGKGLIQPTLWESEPGRVHALFRSTDGRVHRSDSEDGGHTWARAQRTQLPNNNSGLDLARLPDGTLALACNPVAGNWRARTPLSLLFSTDNGETWPARLDVETGPGEFSYPALVASGNGLSLAYTWNRRRVAFARIPLSAIPAP